MTGSNIIDGEWYTLRVAAGNLIGMSRYNSWDFLAGTVADPPYDVQTGPNSAVDQVYITWKAARNNGGIRTTSSNVFVKTRDDEWVEITDQCTNREDIHVYRQCKLDYPTLAAAPYFLVNGDSIWA